MIHFHVYDNTVALVCEEVVVEMGREKSHEAGSVWGCVGVEMELVVKLESVDVVF